MITLDIEIYKEEEVSDTGLPQARYLVHGYDDVLWTDDIEDVVIYIRADLERLSRKTP